jgi:hypothetical protein
MDEIRTSTSSRTQPASKNPGDKFKAKISSNLKNDVRVTEEQDVPRTAGLGKSNLSRPVSYQTDEKYNADWTSTEMDHGINVLLIQ